MSTSPETVEDHPFRGPFLRQDPQNLVMGLTIVDHERLAVLLAMAMGAGRFLLGASPGPVRKVSMPVSPTATTSGSPASASISANSASNA